ncbi:MAG TPA: ROK family protein, partial [Firmicutes bacterium]|nr:ROK family protein [Bacillota bacterium]
GTLKISSSLAALGELAARHSHSLTRPLIFVSVSQGVGGGLILNDTVYCGSNGGAGEIGHMSIDADGKLCECGNRGCLEGVIASGVIGERLGVDSADAFSTLSRRVQAGDADAKMIYQQLVKHLSTALTSVVNLFSPNCIVIGGEITDLGTDFIEDLRKRLEKSCGNVPFNVENLQASRLGSKANLYGAAALVEQQVFPKLRIPREQVVFV